MGAVARAGGGGWGIALPPVFSYLPCARRMGARITQQPLTLHACSRRRIRPATRKGGTLATSQSRLIQIAGNLKSDRRAPIPPIAHQSTSHVALHPILRAIERAWSLHWKKAITAWRRIVSSSVGGKTSIPTLSSTSPGSHSLKCRATAT